MSTEVIQRSNKSAQLVIDLRKRFLEDYENNKGLQCFPNSCLKNF